MRTSVDKAQLPYFPVDKTPTDKTPLLFWTTILYKTPCILATHKTEKKGVLSAGKYGTYEFESIYPCGYYGSSG